MRKIDIINACTDLGVAVNGTMQGPNKLTENIDNSNISNIYSIKADNSNKEIEKDIKKKNLEKLNEFNEKLYDCVLKSIDELYGLMHMEILILLIQQ